MAKIDVRCPKCSKWENIEIPDDITKQSTKGLLTLNVTSGMICEHSFIVYLDKNLIVRDCFIADFKIEISDSLNGQDNSILEADIIKIDLIKLNISEKLIINVFKGIFLGQKILLISDDQFLETHIMNFFTHIFKDSFELKLNIISKEKYMKTQKDYKDYIVLNKQEIIRDKNKIISSKKLEITKSIANKFFKEVDVKASLIIIRNEIYKAYEFSQYLIEIFKNFRDKSLTSKMIQDHIENKYHERIQISYLKFLFEVIKNYFKVPIPKIS